MRGANTIGRRNVIEALQDREARGYCATTVGTLATWPESVLKDHMTIGDQQMVLQGPEKGMTIVSWWKRETVASVGGVRSWCGTILRLQHG